MDTAEKLVLALCVILILLLLAGAHDPNNMKHWAPVYFQQCPERR